MEFLVRLLLITVKLVALFAHALQYAIDFCRRGRRQEARRSVPAISNRLLTHSLRELRSRLQQRQLTAVELVGDYIERIRVVNPQLNAVVAERFEAALLEAADADERIAAAGDVAQLFEAQQLLGLPVTVKESCALSGMPYAVGSMARAQLKAAADGVVVARIRAAGAIPLLVSATPEYCYSIDTDTLLNGRCTNPYDAACTPGGSSGGEGALNGAGASLFGIGSDIGGSIRIPSLFCGIFGHKPTGGMVDVAGHFPSSSDADFERYLVMGPMTRFAEDLSPLLEVMAGEKASLLRLREPLQLSDLQVHYALGFGGINGRMHHAVNGDITTAMHRAVQHLQTLGLSVKPAALQGFRNSLEIALSGMARLRHMQFALTGVGGGGHLWQTLQELIRCLCGRSRHTASALIFDLMRCTNSFMPRQQLTHYRREALALTKELKQLLGESGVLLFPTLHSPAYQHGWTPLHLWGVDYTLIFNILGLPATHVPMGFGSQGSPVGFSVIAAPHQDRLCLRVAVELERAFGGWQPPTPHKFLN